jgi:serine/threonine-protein kinase
MICVQCGSRNVEGSVLCAHCHTPLGAIASNMGTAAGFTSEPTGPLERIHDAPAVFAPGQALGSRYTVVERVGAGGMGLVYKAIDRRLGKTVALKLIQAQAALRPAAQERFRRELALAQQVSHANVCRVHDLGDIEGTVFISMEYVEGQTLEVLIHSMGHLSPTQTVALGRQMCAGLAAIHERGIVHRDLKPGNVMVDRLGHVLLMDFGMAYHKDQERLTQEGTVFGTLAYLSPEQARGQAEFRSDVYAVGLILYEMLTGRRPPGDDGPLPLALRPAEEICPPPSHFSPEVPGALDAIVMRCLERDAGARFASTQELGEALGTLGSSVTQTATMTLRPVAAPPKGWWARPRLLVIAAALVLIAAGLWAWLATRGRDVAAPGERRAVAFLPFEYSGPADSSYLRSILPLTLTESLKGQPALEVTPFTNSHRLGVNEDARQVARALQVTHVVLGTLRVADGNGTGTLRVLRADGSELARHGFAGLTNELLATVDALQDDIARDLGTTGFKTKLTSRSREAMESYLKGVVFLEGWDVPANHARAQDAFQRALALAPDFPEAHAAMALALLNEYYVTHEPRLIERAAEQAESAVQSAPNLPEAYVARGTVAIWRGRSVEATAAFERAAQLAPADEGVARRAGVAYRRAGRPQEAEVMLKRAIELRPDFWDNYNALGILYLEIGRTPDARQQFSRAVELAPNNDVPYGNLAATFIFEGRFLDAEPILRAALRIRPSTLAHSNLGFVYYSLGRFEEAAREWQAGIDLGNATPEARANLGDALRQAGHVREAAAAYEGAVKAFEQNLAVNPGNVEARASYAMTLAAHGRCPEFRAQVRHFAAPQPPPKLAYSLAVGRALCGDHEGAVAAAITAVRANMPVDLWTNPDLRAVAADARVKRLRKS